MNLNKSYSVGFLYILVLIFSLNCNKEKKAEEIDFRTKYFGSFRFRLITEFWMRGQANDYDTFFYNGVIRKFESNDKIDDLYSGSEDSTENVNEMITIEFSQNLKIISSINKDGSLISKSGYHYVHEGRFVNLDSIKFYVGGFGGLGGGVNYFVAGNRIK